MTDPIRVDDLAREFERVRAGLTDKPAGVAAWLAFVALAERPAAAGNAAAGISEDLLMFEVAADEARIPSIRLARTIGLEDPKRDYVAARVLECVLVYDAEHEIQHVAGETIQAWLYPELGRADLAKFVAQATGTAAFRSLVEISEPREISVSLT